MSDSLNDINIKDKINIYKGNSNSTIESTASENIKIDIVNNDNYIMNNGLKRSPSSEYVLDSDDTLCKQKIETKKNIISNSNNNNRKRLYWADCARIYSIFAIIFLHCCGNGCEKALRRRKDPNWIIICCYNCFTRFGVPMFVLLSGTFILDPSKKFSFKKLFKHNILRLATAFTFWSSLNAIYNILTTNNAPPLISFKFLHQFILKFVIGEEYLWFIFMIIGCYLISPFLRFFSDDIMLSRYFLGLCIFWGSFVPTLMNAFTVYKLGEAQKELKDWISRWHFHFTLEFVGYFVAGYHIVKHVNINSFFIRMALYLLGILDVIFFTYLTYKIEKNDETNKYYSKDFRETNTITVAFYSVVLFIFFKHEIGRINFSPKAIKIITKLSSLTFGMYLSHMLLKNILVNKLMISQERFFNYKYTNGPVTGCFILFAIISALSLLISYLLSITPILKKYVL